MSGHPTVPLFWGDFTVDNCLFHHNAAWTQNPGVHGQGGAIWCTFSTATITNSTFHSNFAEEYGGAIASSQDHFPTAGRGSEITTLENCILWGNIAQVAVDEAYMWDSTLVGCESDPSQPEIILPLAIQIQPR